jgi:hypothetical protein
MVSPFRQKKVLPFPVGLLQRKIKLQIKDLNLYSQLFRWFQNFQDSGWLTVWIVVHFDQTIVD